MIRLLPRLIHAAACLALLLVVAVFAVVALVLGGLVFLLEWAIGAVEATEVRE